MLKIGGFLSYSVKRMDRSPSTSLLSLPEETASPLTRLPRAPSSSTRGRGGTSPRPQEGSGHELLRT
ncbi:unnamed protein product [Rangifer tarandus platyrhynchus]|uniref:Uncharacterized protein n=2 Tax=Rangifer tarandus platyrhynchus TaxID=3082113 RepID=A0ABN8YAU8_RANTA|nr:unnamed protein product [Rangifer tarandus platyrhynchus]CAI9698708.1 unnamed protein product [Rangifer tarandus platyrhynchus]